MSATRRFASLGLGASVWRRDRRRRWVRAAARLAAPWAVAAYFSSSVNRPWLNRGLHEVDGPDDACQKVVEIMRQVAGELTHRFHFLRLPSSRSVAAWSSRRPRPCDGRGSRRRRDRCGHATAPSGWNRPGGERDRVRGRPVALRPPAIVAVSAARSSGWTLARNSARGRPSAPFAGSRPYTSAMGPSRKTGRPPHRRSTRPRPPRRTRRGGRNPGHRAARPRVHARRSRLGRWRRRARFPMRPPRRST